MPIHEVQPGECLQSIAFKYGFFWETIWNHAQNAKLRDKYKNPHVLPPGAKVFIPVTRIKHENRPTGQQHKFEYQGVPSKLQLRLVDDNGNLRTGLEYVLAISNGKTYRQRIGADGWIKHPVPPAAPRAHLEVTNEEGETEQYILEFGHLDPITELSGVQQRLINLGFPVDDEEGTFGPSTEEALRDFQRAYGLKDSGEPDKQTVEQLRDAHGS